MPFEGTLTKIAEWLLANGGMFGVLVIAAFAMVGLSLFFVWVLWKALQSLTERYVQQLEKTVDAIKQNSSSMAALAVSVDARTVILSDLSKVAASLVHSSEKSEELQKDILGLIHDLRLDLARGEGS